MKKRLLPLILAFALLLTLMPRTAIPAFAEEGYSGECGDALTWSFDPDTGVLTIEGAGDMWDYGIYFDDEEVCDSPWYPFRNHIKTVTLSENLYYIGLNAFNGCSELTEIELPDSLTVIGSNAFESCTSLTELTIPENVDVIGFRAFFNCENLSVLRVENFNCKFREDCLYGCDNVTIYGWSYSTAELYAEQLELPFESIGTPDLSGMCGEALTWSFDPDTGVLTIEGEGAMYDYEDNWWFDTPDMPWYSFHSQIEELSLTEGLTHVGDNAFSDCDQLESVSFPSSLRSIGTQAFLGCDGLTALSFPDNSVKSIGASAFYCCSGISSLELPEGLREIGSNAFFMCTSLTALRLPDSLEYLGVSAFFQNSSLADLTLSGHLAELGNYAFGYCQNLRTVRLAAGFSAEDPDNSFPALFHYPTDIYSDEENAAASRPTAFIVDENNPCFCADENGVLFNKDKTVLVAYPVGLGGSYTIPEGVVEIGKEAFIYGSKLSAVSFPKSLELIRDRAFAYCSKLRSVKLSNVSEIGFNAFMECSELVEFVCRNPDCLVGALHYVSYLDQDESDEDLDPSAIEYEETFLRSLGLPNQTLIFGIHDDAKEDAEPEIRNQTGDGDEQSYDKYRWLENYAKTNGYTFCALRAFTDVTEGSYYELPVAWAVRMGITSGTSAGIFSPKKICTREQVVTFLWKAVGSPAPNATESPFTDVKPGKYYFKAVLWAVENGITGGVGGGKFGVGRNCTREQVMTFLWKALGSPDPMSTQNPFPGDVKEGKYYYKAVLWAVENDITGGIGDGKFGVGKTCTRAQIVTFLYKAIVMLPPSQDYDAEYIRADEQSVYNAALGEFDALLKLAHNEENEDKRFLRLAQAEAALLDSAVLLPITKSGNATFLCTLNLDRGCFALENGNCASDKTVRQKNDTLAAMNNKNFRKALQHAFDKKAVFGKQYDDSRFRNSYTAPELVSLEHDVTDENGHTFSAGTIYGDVLQYYCDARGCQVDCRDGLDGWYKPVTAKAYLEAAKEELGSRIQWPVQLDVVYNSDRPDQTAAYKESIEGILGAENVTVNLIEASSMDDYYNCFYMPDHGCDMNFDVCWGVGWAPEENDPADLLDVFYAPYGTLLHLLGLY